jgi:hypothetical protein
MSPSPHSTVCNREAKLHGRTSVAQWAGDKAGGAEHASGTQSIYEEKQNKEGVIPTTATRTSQVWYAEHAPGTQPMTKREKEKREKAQRPAKSQTSQPELQCPATKRGKATTIGTDTITADGESWSVRCGPEGRQKSERGRRTKFHYRDEDVAYRLAISAPRAHVTAPKPPLREAM